MKQLTKTEIFKSDQPDFNYKAAQAVYDLVMKMDDDTAEEFVFHVANEYATDLIEKNLRTFQGHLDKVVSKRQEVVKRAIAKAAQDNPEAALPYAQAFSEISKAGWDEDPDWVKRDRSGRFSTKVEHPAGKVKPLDSRTAEAHGIRGTAGKWGESQLEYNKLSNKQKAHFQAEYAQISNFLQTVRASTGGNPGDTDVILHFQGLGQGGRPTSERWHTKMDGTKIPIADLLDTSQQVVGVEARPNTLTTGGAAFNLTGALAGPDTARRIQTIDAIDQKEFGNFAQTWNNEADKFNSNDRRYERVGAASQLLGAGAVPGSKRYYAAKLGGLVGSHGSEAESVFGPAMRKTAYRYRGTEKPVESHLTTLYDRAIMRQKMADLGDNPEGPANTGRRTHGSGKAGQVSATTQMAIQRVTAERRDPTWGERRAGRDVIVDQLKFKLPKKSLYDLQLASGNTPPSEGVIMDKHGKVVTQAVGYGDDHYLPFNLKNLKALKGGEYVRTRSVGGLTSEDIYTGLMSGARQVTVVSRSGTFTMQFDADFKGGRRYNDKAKRMTSRYEQIVDAVQSEQVQRRDVPAPIRQMITSKVKNDYPGEEGSFVRDEVKRRIQDYKSNPELTDEDTSLINALYTRGMAQDGSRDADAYRKEMTNVVMQSKGFMFQLDGRGYGDALKALEEQFPYYIQVDAKIDEDDSDIINLERDKGYVEPGRNRPTNAQAGLFGTQKDNPKGGKFSAALADYQGTARAQRGLRPVDRDQSGQTPTPQGGGANPKVPTSAGKERRAQRVQADASVKVMGDLKASGAVGQKFAQSHPFTALSPAEFSAWIGQKENQKTFNEFLTKVVEPNAGSLNPQVKASYESYKVALSGETTKDWDPAQAYTWSGKPFTFKGAAHAKNADPAIVQNRISQLEAGHFNVDSTKRLGEMTDLELKGELDALEDARVTLKNDPSLRNPDNAEGRRQNAIDLFDDSAKTRLFQESDEGLVNRMKNIHEMRALKSAGAQRMNSQQVVTPGAPQAPQPVHDTYAHSIENLQEKMMGAAIRQRDLQQALNPKKSPARQQEYDLLQELGERLKSPDRITEEEADAYTIMLAELEAQD